MRYPKIARLWRSLLLPIGHASWGADEAHHGAPCQRKTPKDQQDCGHGSAARKIHGAAEDVLGARGPDRPQQKADAGRRNRGKGRGAWGRLAKAGCQPTLVCVDESSIVCVPPQSSGLLYGMSLPLGRVRRKRPAGPCRVCVGACGGAGCGPLHAGARNGRCAYVFGEPRIGR